MWSYMLGSNVLVASYYDKSNWFSNARDCRTNNIGPLPACDIALNVFFPMLFTCMFVYKLWLLPLRKNWVGIMLMSLFQWDLASWKRSNCYNFAWSESVHTPPVLITTEGKDIFIAFYGDRVFHDVLRRKLFHRCQVDLLTDAVTSEFQTQKESILCILWKGVNPLILHFQRPNDLGWESSSSLVFDADFQIAMK